MFNKFRNWFNNNRNEIAIIMLFVSAILSCANLFSGICNSVITTLTCCFTTIGITITVYDYRKNKND